ncbi:hypothetical protein F4818DRAFT_453216 [Hypoxylon cercidicola]|nr:hypothetical protein F4818DRAFT_453216 [Hypoxylon cercidicola]
MRDIYSHADEVIVWLGESTPTKRAAMKLLRTASQHERPTSCFLQDIENLSLPSQQKLVFSLFNNDYFRRAWIIQEIAVASKLRIFCGSDSTSWEVAVACLTAWKETHSPNYQRPGILDPFDIVLGGNQVSIISPPPRNGRITLLNRVAELDSNRRAVAGRNPMALSTLLQVHWLALATDPRDRIFALLGVSRDCQEMKIDYKLSTWDVFLRALRHLVEDRGDLDMLICATGHRYRYYLLYAAPTAVVRPKCPSWMPAFYWMNSYDMWERCHEDPYKYTGAARPFSASKGYCARATIVEHPQSRMDMILGQGLHRATLTAVGVIIGELEAPLIYISTRSVTSLLPTSKLERYAKPKPTWLDGRILEKFGLPSDLSEWIQVIRIAFSYVVSLPLYRGQDPWVVAEPFWRTLVWNRTEQGDEAPDEWSSVFRVIIGGPEHIPPDYAPVTAEGTSLKPSERATAYVTPFLRAFAKLRETEHELHVSSVGPCMTRSGAASKESICIFLGCSVPVIVRPSRTLNPNRKDVKFVGTAYVHTFMYGSIAGLIETGVVETATFAIS